eukprot:3920262-Amphidinium_carterae.1
MQTAVADVRSQLESWHQKDAESALQCVMNTESSCAHAIREGVLSEDSGTWRANCGCRFGRGGARRIPRP